MTSRASHKSPLLCTIFLLTGIALPCVFVESGLQLYSIFMPRLTQTNLSPEELESISANTSGSITKLYRDHLMANSEWQEPHGRFFYGGQVGRQVEFLIHSQWNNMICHDGIDYAPAKNNRGILFLGDSFVEALQVPAELTFYALFREFAQQRQYAVWGCGVSGASPLDFVLNLDDSRASKLVGRPVLRFPGLASLNPEIVFYFLFLGNDWRNEAPRKYQQFVAKIGSCNLRVDSSFLLLERIRRFMNIHGQGVSGASITCIEDEYWPYLEPPPTPVREGLKALKRSILLLKEVVENRNARLMVGIIEPYPVPYGDKLFRKLLDMNYPGAKSYEVSSRHLSEEIERYLYKNGIPNVNFSRIFGENRSVSPYYLSDGHLTPDGHRLIAKYLQEHFSDLFLSP